MVSPLGVSGVKHKQGINNDGDGHVRRETVKKKLLKN